MRVHICYSSRHAIGYEVEGDAISPDYKSIYEQLVTQAEEEGRSLPPHCPFKMFGSFYTYIEKVGVALIPYETARKLMAVDPQSDESYAIVNKFLNKEI